MKKLKRYDLGNKYFQPKRGNEVYQLLFRDCRNQGFNWDYELIFSIKGDVVVITIYGDWKTHELVKELIKKNQK